MESAITPPSIHSQTSATSSSRAEASRRKTRSACNRCHQQKLRCTKAKGQTSCERCFKLKTDCRHSLRNRRNAQSRPLETPSGIEQRSLAPAIGPARPDMRRSVSDTLAAEGTQYDWLYFPDVGMDNAESLGYIGYESWFPMHYVDRAPHYVLPGRESMTSEVGGNHSLDVFDSYTAPEDQRENPSVELGRSLSSAAGRLSSLNVALYECASKLPFINAYRVESVGMPDIPYAFNSSSRIAALLALDDVFCVTKNFIDVISNLFLTPGCHETPKTPTLAATLTTLASSHLTWGANTESRLCVAPHVLTHYRKLVSDPILQAPITGVPHGPEISSLAIQPFPHLDEATALLFLSCHCRLIEIYEVIFQAMQHCIERSYAAPHSTAGTTLPQLKQVGGFGGVSFPALRVDFNGPQLPPATSSMYLALITTLSSQLWAEIKETLSLKGEETLEGLSNRSPIANLGAVGSTWDIAIKRTDNMSRIIEAFRQFL
ncbi:hypothetical protein F4782DRAFT_380611 [Xylaria castorea]|nr:hypothetical protein F4782DRAFT_380611 [Xylaria castorea]